ncbi:MAG: EAL domain-containing protein [Nocardioidaceae bacterium]
MSSIVSVNARRGGLALQLALVTFLRSSAVQGVGAVTATLLLAWGSSYAAGGSHTSLPHLFYIPVVLAAVRFSWSGALFCSVGATLLAGPALPSVVATGQSQSVSSWLIRGAVFLFVALFIAWGLRDRTESLGSAVQDALISARLSRALVRGEITVAYQPIVDLRSKDIVAVEALARWEHARRGAVSPGRFVPAAERTGTITVLDRYVLKRAVQQAHAWRAALTPVKVSVNLSAASLAERDLVAYVQKSLTRTGLEAAHLQLEITESAVINDSALAAQQIRQLRGLGVSVAIDDFGAGQASLGYLNHFTVDTVKIDRSLITDIADRPEAARLIAAAVQLFHNLDLTVVAEGIETSEQCAALEAMNCRLSQGYYTGRPASAETTQALLRKVRPGVLARNRVESCPD